MDLFLFKDFDNLQKGCRGDRIKMDINGNRIVCFTGHRTIPPAIHAKLKQCIADEVDRQISLGATVFRTGGAVGFDTVSARTVLEARIKNPQIRLELVLPCPDQTVHWNATDIAVYEEIKQEADSVRYVAMSYRNGVYQMRNRQLAQNADVCIAYLVDEFTHSGGTAYTVLQALQNGAELINLAEKV